MAGPSEQASPAAAGDGLHCADCGTVAGGSYCPHCGQETRIETPTVRQFALEFLDQYIALEGKLGRTLKVLVTAPGQLTLDYLHGRRQRYVRPLKLYLTISVIFFGIIGVLPDSSSNPLVRTEPGDAAALKREARHEVREARRDIHKALVPPSGHSAAMPSVSDKQDDSGDEDSDDGDAEQSSSSAANGPPAASARRLKGVPKAWAGLPPEEQSRLMREKLSEDAPYRMFLLLPLFALLLKWMFRGNRLLYGVHLLFSVHLHCFAFLVLALGFLPLPSFGHTLLQWVVVIYLLLALRRVYQRGWWSTLWRVGVIYALYGIAIGTTVLSGVMNAVLGS
jgi:hypothetical protein